MAHAEILDLFDTKQPHRSFGFRCKDCQDEFVSICYKGVQAAINELDNGIILVEGLGQKEETRDFRRTFQHPFHAGCTSCPQSVESISTNTHGLCA